MLSIVIPEQELWDEAKEEMIYTKRVVLKLEHSLISVSKWEAKWCVPFFDSEKTTEQTLDYIRCMTLNPDVDPDVYNRLTQENVDAINKYIAAPMTATVINSNEKKKKSSEFITSELIYYWMIAYNVPVAFEKWHLNRLIMLIRVCSEKNKPPKKMSGREIMSQNRALNAARRARLGTKG